MPECYFAHLGGCEGRLVKAHLIPKQSLKRELYYRALKNGMHKSVAREEAANVVWDARCWRWVCGGYGYGSEGHHGQVDAKQISWGPWPEDLIEFLKEHDLEWMAVSYA